MTQWTPELERNIRKLSDSFEKDTKAMINPNGHVRLGIAFSIVRGIKDGLPAYKKICRATGLSSEGGLADARKSGNLQRIIELAEANGSDAADKLKRALAIQGEVDAIKKEVCGPKGCDLVKMRELIKQRNLKL